MTAFKRHLAGSAGVVHGPLEGLRARGGGPVALSWAWRLGVGAASGLVAALLSCPGWAAVSSPGVSDRATSGYLDVVSVRIVGREHVSSALIEAELAREGIQPHMRIEGSRDPRVSRARARLSATGYFRRVTFRLEPVEAATRTVALVVELEERGSLEVKHVSLGSSQLTPFWGGVSAEERNFLGRGLRLGGGFVWGSLPTIARARRQQAYRLSAEIPRLGRSPVGLVSSAYFVAAGEPYRVQGRRGDPDPAGYRAFDLSRLGGVLGVTLPVLPSLSFGVDYRFERADARLPQVVTFETNPYDLQVRDGVHRLTTAHLAVNWDGREEAKSTGKGGRFSLDLQVSSPALGSSYEYIKIVAGGAYTFRLPWRHWITPSVVGGQIAGVAPRFERFYGGDLSDWTPGRELGLRYSTRNPIDVFHTGIDKREFGSLFGRVDVEYVWPLFRRSRTRIAYGGDLFLSLGIFTLAGARDERAQDRAERLRVAPVGLNANFGVRLETALGTLDLSVGNVLRRTPL